MSDAFNRADFVPATTQVMRYLLKSDWQIMFEKSQRLLLNAGDVLIREGSSSDGLYMLRTGMVRVEQTRSEGAVLLSRRGPGNVLGEIALLDVSPSMASVVAEELSEVYLIERRQLNALLNSAPGLAVRFYLSLATLLAERLTESAEMVSRMHAMPNFSQIMTEHGNSGEIEAFAERLARFVA